MFMNCLTISMKGQTVDWIRQVDFVDKMFDIETNIYDAIARLICKIKIFS